MSVLITVGRSLDKNRTDLLAAAIRLAAFGRTPGIEIHGNGVSLYVNDVSLMGSPNAPVRPFSFLPNTGDDNVSVAEPQAALNELAQRGDVAPPTMVFADLVRGRAAVVTGQDPVCYQLALANTTGLTWVYSGPLAHLEDVARHPMFAEIVGDTRATRLPSKVATVYLLDQYRNVASKRYAVR